MFFVGLAFLAVALIILLVCGDYTADSLPGN